MSPVEIFRIAMILLAFYGPGTRMGCNTVTAQANHCWVVNYDKNIVANIKPDGITYSSIKPLVPATPTPTPKGTQK